MLEDVRSGDQDSVIATLMKAVCLIFSQGATAAFQLLKEKADYLQWGDTVWQIWGIKHIRETNICSFNNHWRNRETYWNIGCFPATFQHLARRLIPPLPLQRWKKNTSLRSPPPSTPLSSFRMTRHLCWAMALMGSHGVTTSDSETRAHPTRHPHAILLPVRLSVLVKGNHITQIHSEMEDSYIILWQSHGHSCIQKYALHHGLSCLSVGLSWSRSDVSYHSSKMTYDA